MCGALRREAEGLEARLLTGDTCSITGASRYVMIRAGGGRRWKPGGMRSSVSQRVNAPESIGLPNVGVPAEEDAFE